MSHREEHERTGVRCPQRQSADIIVGAQSYADTNVGIMVLADLIVGELACADQSVGGNVDPFNRREPNAIRLDSSSRG